MAADAIELAATSSSLKRHRTLQDLTYGSIPTVTDEQTPLCAEDGDMSTPSRRRAPSFMRDKLLLLVLTACLVTITTVLLSGRLPDDDGMSSWMTSIAEVPMLGRSRKKYEAQRLANNFRISYLGEGEEDQKHKGKKDKDIKVIHAPVGCEGSVMIVRHCDKGTIREHCDYVGYERAVYLATLFGDGHERWPTPSYIYAMNPGGRKNSKKKNYREIEMVQPLADKANITIDTSFNEKHSSDLAKHLLYQLKSGEMCGKLAVVSWKHSDIPHLAHRLGCGPNQGCPLDYPSMNFDDAWQLKFVYHKMWHSERKNLKKPKKNQWLVYGSVQQERFDALSFSKQFGDYRPGGTPHGARWRERDEEVPDRDLS